MNKTRRALAAFATFAVAAGALAGCAADTGGSGGGSSDSGNVELTLTTWGEFGYEDLIPKFEEANPGITVAQRKSANGDAARDANNTYLAAGSGLGDVVAVESGWLAQMMQYPDEWVPVADDLADRWLDWKSASATDNDGTLRMYGVDAAPAGLCYNRDLFEQAGLPTDRAEVAQLLTGDWDNFLAVGADFTAATGVPWLNASSSIGTAQIAGLEVAFQERDGEIIATTNPDVKEIYDNAVGQVAITANMPTFGEDWTKGLGQNSFATQICPSWMLGVIKSSAPDSTSWDVADVIPGSGLSQGGSYLAVPTQSEHPEEAQKLADFLTAPEQQLAAFAKVGAFPSQVEALQDDTLLATTDPYFQDAPSGEIFSNRADAIEVRTYQGPLSGQISTIFADAINRVEAGASPEESWAKFESDVDSLQ